MAWGRSRARRRTQGDGTHGPRTSSDEWRGQIEIGAWVDLVETMPWVDFAWTDLHFEGCRQIGSG